MTSSTMIRQLSCSAPRTLGKTSLQLGPLGFGAAPVGNLYQAMSDSEAHAAISEALTCGFRYFDTAPYYGFGLSEKRLGHLLREHRGADEIVLSTKVGRVLRASQPSSDLRYGFASEEPFEPVFDYSYDGVLRSFESSLERLGCERIHILLAHDLGQLTHVDAHSAMLKDFVEGGYLAMRELKAEGRIDAIGLGVNEWQVAQELSSHVDLDCVLLAGRYSLLEQNVIEHFFPLCEQRSIDLIIGGPFNSGILAQGSRAKALHYNYEAAPGAIVTKVRELEAVCAEFSLPLAAAALQFPALNKQVCAVVAGFASAAQVNQAQQWWDCKISPDFWQELQRRGLLSEALTL